MANYEQIQQWVKENYGLSKVKPIRAALQHFGML